METRGWKGEGEVAFVLEAAVIGGGRISESLALTWLSI